jgi:hypothetical protein
MADDPFDQPQVLVYALFTLGSILGLVSLCVIVRLLLQCRRLRSGRHRDVETLAVVPSQDDKVASPSPYFAAPPRARIVIVPTVRSAGYLQSTWLMRAQLSAPPPAQHRW